MNAKIGRVERTEEVYHFIFIRGHGNSTEEKNDFTSISKDMSLPRRLPLINFPD